MRARYLVIGLVLVLAGVTGVLVYRNQQQVDDTASGVVITVTQTVGASSAPGSRSDPALPSSTPPTTTSPAGPSTRSSAKPTTSRPPTSSTSASPTTSAAGRPVSNVPMKKLKKGEKPPQFVIFSFDGAGSHEKWHEFMNAAAPTESRFTGFLSGIYLLESAKADAYTGPGHSPGAASISFGGTADEVITEVEDLNEAYARGHEIGTHYNGHFCAGNEPSGASWSTADWNSELAQFFGFLKNWRSINGLPDAPALTVPLDSIKGGRTPCLEGELDALIPAWKKHGMTYDSSINAPSPGLSWPAKLDGIWEFYMPYIYSPGFDGMTVAMDYNFWVKFNGGKDDPASAPELRQKVAATYEYMWDEAYNGNRAPILIANHFNKWNGDSFNPPAKDFMQDKCGRPNTYCATYSDVIAWMELQDPAVIEGFQSLPAVAAGP